MNYYKLTVDDIIVIFDDISLEPENCVFGQEEVQEDIMVLKVLLHILKVRNLSGLSLVLAINPKGWDLVDWVLGRFPDELCADIKEGRQKACDAIQCIISEGIDSGYESV